MVDDGGMPLPPPLHTASRPSKPCAGGTCGLAPVVETVDIVLQFHRLAHCLGIIPPVFKQGRHLFH